MILWKNGKTKTWHDQIHEIHLTSRHLHPLAPADIHPFFRPVTHWPRVCRLEADNPKFPGYYGDIWWYQRFLVKWWSPNAKKKNNFEINLHFPIFPAFSRGSCHVDFEGLFDPETRNGNSTGTMLDRKWPRSFHLGRSMVFLWLFYV